MVELGEQHLLKQRSHLHCVDGMCVNGPSPFPLFAFPSQPSVLFCMSLTLRFCETGSCCVSQAVFKLANPPVSASAGNVWFYHHAPSQFCPLLEVVPYLGRVPVLSLGMKTKSDLLFCLSLAPGGFVSPMAPGLAWKLLLAWGIPTKMGKCSSQTDVKRGHCHDNCSGLSYYCDETLARSTLGKKGLTLGLYF